LAADRAASVLARLKNKAAETKRSNQLCLQLFCQEEFLRRLEKSRYADNMILKGGLFVYALTGFDSRVTVDVDFLLKNVPNSPEKLRLILEEIIAEDTGNDFVAFEISKIEPIAIMKKYAGVGATIVAKIKNTRTIFGIDFGVGDVIVPKQKKRQMPTQLDDFEPPTVSAYSIETVVAEKLDAALTLLEYSSRMKDYYDIVYIARKFDFDGNVLCQAISKTFANRSREFEPGQFERLLELDDNVAMQKKWAAFLKKIKIEKLVFSDVIDFLAVFLRDVTAAAISSQRFDKFWSSSQGRWSQD
jgi:predicted nucleotidyltransferase component of viral defense system